MKCQRLKNNGEQCGANAMQGSDFCYLHNPDITFEEKREAQARGGASRTPAITSALPMMNLEKPQDAVLLLADTINRVRTGELDVRIANTVGYLTGHLIKALEVASLNDRVDIVERVIMERRQTAH